ncbi:glycosyltransferase [Nonomuraea sp. NPDC050786]|uniref:glycosyltransferase n=1 Tax=Nonomuraea sp. NPDC050786 TaxID=3154840 RepID=UPI003403CF5E
MDVSIIIPCHNAADQIGTQLDALAAEECPDDWGVVVVDDGSTDALESVVRRYQHRLPGLVLVKLPRRSGTGAARNAGARASAAAKLLFLDADDLIASGYLKAMTVALADGDLIGSRIDYSRLNSEETLRRCPPKQLGEVPSATRFLPVVPGGLMGLSRALFDEVGGFDEALPALADLDLCFRAQLAGRAIHMADTVVSVRMRSSSRGHLRRGLFQGRDVVLLREKFLAHGLDPVTWPSHLKACLKVLMSTPMMLGRARRWQLAWDLGWHIGVLSGLMARRERDRDVRT